MLKWPYYPKQFTDSMFFLTTHDSLHRTRKSILKCTGTKKEIDKEMPSKKDKTAGIMLPNFKLYYRVIVTKTAQYWYGNRHRPMEQNREPKNKATHLQLFNLLQS